MKFCGQCRHWERGLCYSTMIPFEQAETNLEAERCPGYLCRAPRPTLAPRSETQPAADAATVGKET
jgi:hypothetical protein